MKLTKIKSFQKVFKILLPCFYYHLSLLTFEAIMQIKYDKRGKCGIRQILLTTFLLMLSGTAFELYLLDHYEGFSQLIPLLCIFSSTVLVLVLSLQKKDRLISFFQFILLLTACSGLYGTLLHLQANYEFELEMKPTETNWNLFVESLSGALPALAPCSLIVLALIGYSYSILLKQK